MSSWSFSATVNLAGLEQKMRELATMQDALEDVAIEIKNETVKNIDNKNIIDTGDLRASIGYEMIEDGFIVGDGRNGKDHVDYGIYNEFGTSRMAARPFLIPAAEKYYTFIVRRFTELLR